MQDDKLSFEKGPARWQKFTSIFGLFCLCITAFLLLNSKYAQVWLFIPLGIFALYLTYRNLFPCVLAYCFIIPLETLQASSSLGMSKTLGGLLIAVCLLRLMLKREKLYLIQLPVFKPLFLWLAFVFLGLLTTISPGMTVAGIRMLLPPLCIFFFCLFCIDTRKKFILVLKSYALGATLCAILALPFSRRDTAGRLIGFGDDPNFVSAGFIVGLALCTSLAVRARGKMRILWALCACSQVALVLQSQSRAGVAVIAVQAFILLLPFIKKINTRTMALVLLCLCIGVGALAVASPQKLVHRFASIFSAVDGTKDISTLRRLSYIPVALRNLANNPLMGSGNNTYPLVYARSPYALMWASDDSFRYAHNTFLEMYSDLGLIGGTAFLLIFVLSLSRLYRLRNHLIKENNTDDATLITGEIVAMGGLMLMLLTISWSFSKPLWLLTTLAQQAPWSFMIENYSSNNYADAYN